MAFYDEKGKELAAEELEQLFNPFYGMEFIYRYGLVFLEDAHLKAFEEATPGKLREDTEWASTVYMLTTDNELRDKAACYLNPANREVNWNKILSNDFGSGHYAAIYWAFGLWSGHSWGGWEIDGEIIPQVDTISRASSMDSLFKIIALVAQAYRWGLQQNIHIQAKTGVSHKSYIS